ncbi:hypothetical protein [Thermocrispum municipale]|uniref:hypothetical protein n=1 Tax=Thermocrispum municipale TaxID=37926 RepID=UPI00040219EC|nr:hypothetical protein [Thermocrispum municipale]
MTRGAKSDEDRRSWELFGKRFVWSHFWWVAALLLGLAVARLFLMPVTTDWISGTTTLDCGYTYTADATVVGDTETRQGDAPERAECAQLRDAAAERGVAYAVIAILPIWLGVRQSRGHAVPWQHVAATVCLGVSLMLLLGPHQAGNKAECGSPLWVAASDSGRAGDADEQSCLIERPSRVAWAVLWGIASVPFVIAGTRTRDED